MGQSSSPMHSAPPGSGRYDDVRELPLTVAELLMLNIDEPSEIRRDDPFQGHLDQSDPALQMFNSLNNRAALDTCDVILFRGRGWRARLIQFFTGRYSHVGIVHRRYGPNDVSRLYLLESVSHDDGVMCTLHPHRRRRGVRHVLLQERLEQYLRESPDGLLDICIVKVMVRPLPPQLGYSRVEMGRLLDEFEQRVCSADYDDSALHLAHHSTPLINSLSSNPADLRDYTCSELVGAALLHTQVLNDSLRVADLQSPNAFINGTINSRHWRLGYFSSANLHMRLRRPPTHHILSL